MKSQLSGAEPTFAPEEYNGDKAIRHSHNCFAQAMNVRDKERIQSCREKGDCHFHVPGKTKGHPEFSGKLGKTCGDVLARTMADVPQGQLIDYANKCRPGFSKVGVVVDEENDLHQQRQDNNGWWSHKPGGRPVTNLDAAGAKIWAPHLASRYYPAEYPGNTGLNQDSFCSQMCVPRNKPIQVAGASQKKSKTRRSRK